MKEMLSSSFSALSARERVRALFAEEDGIELLDPFQKLYSPHLWQQDLVPQSDDGVVVGLGRLQGHRTVVVATEGKFQGGAIGEIGGAKMAAALELALLDHQKGIPTAAILILETGGIRLQEANYGLLALAEVQSAIVALRQHQPVIAVVASSMGCYGGLSITAGLCSAIIMTKQGRLSLNGPEVIEQEAGLLEWDARDRPFIWATSGGEQRYATEMVDILVDDEVATLRNAIAQRLDRGVMESDFAKRAATHQARLFALNPIEKESPLAMRKRWPMLKSSKRSHNGQGIVPSRGRTWLSQLAHGQERAVDGVPSVLYADVSLGPRRVRYLTVVPNAENRFPRARQGEVGLDEASALTEVISDAVRADESGFKRDIIAIVDVPSQAFGYLEELYGLHQALASTVAAYAEARQNGHRVLGFLVGKAISGAFLAHGLQADTLLALDDSEVMVQVMSKSAAARITKRSEAEWAEYSEKIPAIAYDIGSFVKLGSIQALIQGVNMADPSAADVLHVEEQYLLPYLSRDRLHADLSHRLHSENGQKMRAWSVLVREAIAKEWY